MQRTTGWLERAKDGMARGWCPTAAGQCKCVCLELPDQRARDAEGKLTDLGLPPPHANNACPRLPRIVNVANVPLGD